MKRKLLCIAVAIIMILPLAFAAIPTASAAGTLSSVWTKFENTVAGEGKGDIAVGDDGSIALNSNAQGFQTVAMAYNEKVAVDGLEIAFTLENLYIGADGLMPIAIGGILDIELSADKATGIVNYTQAGTMGGNKSGLDLNATRTAGLVFLHALDGTDIKTGLFGGMQSLVAMDYLHINYFATADANGKTEVTLKLVVNGDVVDVYINDTKIDAASFPKETVLDEDGKAYLYFTNTSYGGAHINATIKTINDKAANKFGLIFDPDNAGWEQLTASDVGGAGLSNGTVTVNKDCGITFGVPAGMNWPQAGVAYNDKFVVDGAEFVINAKAFTDASPNGYAAIHMCADQFSDYGIGILGGRTYAVTVPDLFKSFSFTIYGTTLKIWIDGAGGSYDTGIALTPETDITVKFVVEDDEIKFLVNGEKVQVNVEGEPVDVAIPAAGIIDADGKAYLALSAVGYGSSGCEAFTVKTINGVAAALYKGAATYTDHKATTPVVQWRAPAEGVAAGLRFKTTVALNNVNNNDSIVKMGTIIMPSDKVTSGYLGHTADGKIDGTSYLDIVANNYYEKTEDSISFTAVLIGIPENQLDRIFLAVSYIEYADGTITYGGLRAVSINDAMNA